MTMLLALLAALSLQSQSGPAVAQQAVPVSRLEIPDEIAPAIVPYLRCKLDSIGQPGFANGARLAPTVPVGADCSNARAEAARRAERMLADRGHGNETEQRAFVERALASADAFAETARPTPPAQETPDASH